MADKNKRTHRVWHFIKDTVPMKSIVFLAVIVVGLGLFMKTGLGITHLNKSNTIKMDFENIGELATQSAYCRQINVTSDVRTLFGMDIPFTQSKYVYSYDVIIKAGFDFAEIEPMIDEDNKIITIKMPAAKVLSNEIKDDSLEIYLEKESIFTPITLTENNEARIELKNKAIKDAVANNLFEDTRKNAELLLKSFIGKQYDLNTYKLVFEHVTSEEEQTLLKEQQAEEYSKTKETENTQTKQNDD